MQSPAEQQCVALPSSSVGPWAGGWDFGRYATGWPAGALKCPPPQAQTLGSDGGRGDLTGKGKGGGLEPDDRRTATLVYKPPICNVLTGCLATDLLWLCWWPRRAPVLRWSAVEMTFIAHTQPESCSNRCHHPVSIITSIRRL